MKALLKRSLRNLLRPLVHKVDGRICWLVESTVRPLVVAELEQRVIPTLDATRADVRASCARTEDLVAYLRRSSQQNTLLLDSLVRELVRLQMQVESLEASVLRLPEFDEATAAGATGD
jgi:hypothetical protein